MRTRTCTRAGGSMAAAGACWPDDDGKTANLSWAVEGDVNPYFVELELVEEPRPAQAWGCAAKDVKHVLAQVSFHGFGAAEPPIPGLRKGAILRWRNARCFEQLQPGGLAFISRITLKDLPNIRLVRYAGDGADGDGAGAGGPDGTSRPDGREVFWQEVLEASPRALLGAYIDLVVADDPDPQWNWRSEAGDQATNDVTAGEDLVGLLSFPGSSPRQPPLPGLRMGAVLRWRNPRCLGLHPFGLICAPISVGDLGNLRVLEHVPFKVERGGVVVQAGVGSVPRPVLQQAPQGAGSRPAAAGASRARPKARGQAREQQAPAEPMSAREWAINICMGLLMVAIAIFIYNSGDGATRWRS
ncbi:hypothetical protein HYH03_003360 [Edaphochlamys debaryana]|uniref:Uncharacterized protein n=1 Tax=Edaphochlamys debaryana TaxID=47281 RepID=A0A836C309_9CHLO|nr:hypothetical protein HYH03_003360 [Edaphochlamys debaryana]|eukprot:KAG2498611.1 hypothetical protein HYH03_003360 [Edaphochlamys debaryana]